MSKFKVGHKIVVLARNSTLNNEIKINDIRTVTDTQSDGVELDSIADGWVHDVDIELASKIIKPKWTIYNNKLPWSELSDKQKGKLLLAGHNGITISMKNGIFFKPAFDDGSAIYKAIKPETAKPEPTMAELFLIDWQDCLCVGGKQEQNMISKGWTKTCK
jgi:hypothetical protein